MYTAIAGDTVLARLKVCVSFQNHGLNQDNTGFDMNNICFYPPYSHFEVFLKEGHAMEWSGGGGGHLSLEEFLALCL